MHSTSPKNKNIFIKIVSFIFSEIISFFAAFKTKRYWLLAVLVALALLMPSLAWTQIRADYVLRFELSPTLTVIFCALTLPLVRPAWFAILILTCFLVLEIINFSHMIYFNTPLDVYSLHLALHEAAEIADSAVMVFHNGSGVSILAILIIFYLIAIIAIYKNRKNIKHGQKSLFATVLVIYALSILPHKALVNTPKINNFLPRNDSISLYNSLNTITAYTCLFLPHSSKHIATHMPYKTTKIPAAGGIKGDFNMVFIIGESVNGDHIGLLGYERNTTPLLGQMAQNDKNFYASKAISSAVLTKVSLPMMMNISYFPDDVQHTLNQSTHLFKLAKENGFNTFYIGGQTQSEGSAMAPNYVDEYFTRESYPIHYEEVGDIAVLEKVDEFLPRFSTGRNFIVIHQRSAHSPYEQEYRAYKKAAIWPTNVDNHHDYKRNSYDNAMVFNDYFIHEVFMKFKALNKPTIVIFVPDHAEAIGEEDYDGKPFYGHSYLHYKVSNIPVFATSYNMGDADFFIPALRSINRPTHYEISKLIAKVLGYEVINPEEKPGEFYINGIDIAGDAGFIKVKKDSSKLGSDVEFSLPQHKNY